MTNESLKPASPASPLPPQAPAARRARLRRFRCNLPQRIAAGLLFCFLAQGLWLIGRATLSDRDYQYARCGRETWESPSAVSGYYTTCGNIHDGILAYRVAGLPLTLNLQLERMLDRFRAPENRVLQGDGPVSSWELRHQMTHTLWLLRLPFLAAGCLLGGALWWVTRRQFGNLGGYTALALYCFCPAVIRAAVTPSPEVLAMLGIYAGIYTAIGVAHAMQGPRRKWRPRIVLLTLAFGLAYSAHIAALPVTVLMALGFMFWIAEGRRALIVPILLLTTFGALVLLFACYGFSPDAFSYLFRSSAGFLWISLDPARHFFTLAHAGIALASVAALALYATQRRSRFFGNTVSLICAAVFLLLVMTGAVGSPWLWSLPFLFTFIAGAFADAYESPQERVALAAGGAIVLLQAAICVATLAGVI
jgi:hypothetical protein